VDLRREPSQEILLLDEIIEEPPPPRAMPTPRPLSSPKPGVPMHIGAYQITRSYSSGMVDGVYRAYKLSPHGLLTQAVLKWARRSRPDFEVKREVLLDEAKALAAIHHPNVVRLLDTDEDEDGLYIALEFIPGTDLRTVMSELVRQNLRLPSALSCYVAVCVLRGLDHAHRAVDDLGHPLDIIHRDVTPSNILLSHEGHLKLTDFGVVRMNNRQQPVTLPGLVKGKFRYMAPEYVEGGPPSTRSDIYAVGVTLFELFSGRYAFNEEGRRNIFKAIMEDGLDLSPLSFSNTPRALVDVVARATDRRPEQRYGSAGAMADALESWLRRSGNFVSASALAQVLKQLDLPEG
jgi:serine/threonine protein kinase